VDKNDAISITLRNTFTSLVEIVKCKERLRHLVIKNYINFQEFRNFQKIHDVIRQYYRGRILNINL